jgi:GTP 3',8-cyclase
MSFDRFGRNINYLRISLTDRCNLRCVYCMPEDMTFRPRAELLQDDEILRLVRLFAELGFHKFRLTGGEPTVRANVVEIVAGIANTPGVRTVAMTTNGLLLARQAQSLAEAGLAPRQRQYRHRRSREIPQADALGRGRRSLGRD